jgi:ribose transport system permease protein
MSISTFVARFRLLIIVLMLGAVLSILYPRFLTTSNLSNVLWSICVIAIMCTGAIYTPITGGIDLSVGSVAAISGIVVNYFMNTAGLPVWPSLFLTITIGVLIGLFSGIVVTKFRVHGFIVTMAAKTYLFGIAMYISNGAWIAISGPKEFLEIGGGKLLGFPVPIYIMLAIALLSHVLLKYTVYGRQVIAVGANDVTARMSGVKSDRVKMIAYALSSGTAAIAGIVMASIAQQAYAVAAQGYELNVITALVVGGTSLLGGSGSVIGALLGAIMVGFIDNGLNLMNVEAAYHPIVTGVVIIVALILNNGFELPKRLRTKVALLKQPAN